MMGRPLYETDEHRSREAALIERVEQRWNARAEKLPIRYEIDYALMRGPHVAAWAELKCRNNSIGAYNTYILSLAKWQAGCALARETGKPFLLVVEFTDACGFVRTENGHAFPVAIGGRRDRGDKADIEPIIEIPMAAFKTL